MKTLFTLFLFLCAGAFGFSQCTDLFISEYIEGSSSNKAFEIFNPTSSTVSLSNYVVYRNNNGSPTPTDSLFPMGTLASGAVFVIANPSADSAILAQADTLHTMTFYNGDDALWLMNTSTGDTLDIIGEIGIDPGTNWSVGTGATSNFTLIRQMSVNEGTTDWPTSQTQWDVYPIDMVDSLGFHNFAGCAGCTPTIALIVVTACDSYTSPSGDSTWTVSGLYNDTITNAAGCDSLLRIDLTVNYSSTSVISPTECDSYTGPSGHNTWTSSGTYMDTIPNSAGCDSIITINLTIITVDTGVTVTDPTMTANAVGASYQWVNCDSGFAPIPGATGQSFTPTSNGNYAVIVWQGNCVDTSACVSIISAGIHEKDVGLSPVLYPNPSDGQVTLLMPEVQPYLKINLVDVSGRLLFSKEFRDSDRVDLVIPAGPGMYFLEVVNGFDERTVMKLIIE